MRFNTSICEFYKYLYNMDDLLASSVSFIGRGRALFNGLCIAAYFALINRKIGPRLVGAVF